MSIDDECKVAVIADWDADGVVGASLIYYAQEKRGVFPVKGAREKVCLVPSGPRSILESIGGKCWEHVVIIDIPLTVEVEEALAKLKECGAKIYYFDHHESTLKRMAELEEKYGVFGVIGKSSSAVIIKRFLEGLGLRFTQRMKDFVAAVAVLEGGRRYVDSVNDKIVTMAASISKMLNQTRNREAWEKYVRWIGNPLPFESPGIKLPKLGEKGNLLEYGAEVSERADKELKEAAVKLAMSAENLGYIKFVDARDEWRKRGSSALASAIYKIVNMPVAVVVEKSDGARLLVIRSGHGEARVIMDYLYERGVVIDKGGHRNIAVARLSDAITIRRLKEELRKAVIYAFRKRSSPEDLL